MQTVKGACRRTSYCTTSKSLMFLRWAKVNISICSSCNRIFWSRLVKTGRATRSNCSTKKTYGCIFTCLRYKAVHVELAENLSTHSFLNALTRLIGRRGPSSVIYSDNGTNLRGAEYEIWKALKDLDKEIIHANLLKKRNTWIFYPPAASLGTSY